ncbi:hypothetical protein AGLY_014170, partial [Aphis glycines]
NGDLLTRNGDLLVDLGKSAKSRSAAEPLRRALVDKLGDHAAAVSILRTMVELEVVDLDSVATKDEVLHAVVTALVDKHGADDHSIVGAVSSISVTSMWALRSGQQVAVVKVLRGLKLTEVTHVRVGWTSCRLRPRHPEATRCYRCHGFGHTADACKGPDLKDGCRRCGLLGHLEAGCTAEAEQCGWLQANPPQAGIGRLRRSTCCRTLACDHPNMNIQFLQLNLNGNWAAQQLLGQVAAQRGADLLLLSEPFVRGGSDRWCYSLDRKASLGISPGSGFIHDEKGSGQEFAWMMFGDLSVFSCYWRPGLTLQEYAYFLGDLEDAIRARGDSKLVIGGDFNAWNVEWGSRTNNPRGDLLADFAASLGLSLCNTGNTPTFARGDATSVIDVTFSRGVEISGWEVLDELSLSDHFYVAYGIKPALPAQPVEAPVDAIHPGWSLRSLNLEAFQGYVRNTPLTTGRGIASRNHANASAERLDNYIVSACDVAMSLRTQEPPGKRPMYWWSDAIDCLCQKALRLRRAYQASLRRIGHPGSQAARAEFTAARRALWTEIRRSKEQAWKDLCRQVDSDPWGRPYKLVMRKFGDGTARLVSKGREDAISDHLFPTAPITDWDSMPSPEIRNLFDAFDPENDELVFTREIPRFSADELFKAARRLSSGKASRPSEIPNEILRRIVQARPRSILKVYNDCLESLTFPTKWKSAKLVLLHKGAGKPVASPSRPENNCRRSSIVRCWMASHGLQLAHHKTEAVMLTRRRAYNPPQLIIGGHQIELSPHLRYLGVILDSKLSFGKHVETVASKAATSAAALSRLMPNVSGPGQWSQKPAAVCCSRLGRNRQSLDESDHQPPEAPEDGSAEGDKGL